MAIMVPSSSYRVSVTTQGLISPNKSESAAKREALKREKQPIGPRAPVPTFPCSLKCLSFAFLKLEPCT